MAEKLKLIDADLLMKLLNQSKPTPSPPINPTLRELNHIENSINTTLAGKSSPAQVSEINNLIAKYKTYQENYESRPQVPPISNIPVEADNSSNDWIEKAVDSAPPAHRRQIKGLLNHIKKLPGMGWDSQGRLIRAGQVIPNTNILDLAHSVIRPRKTFTPPGVYEFISSLTENNTPLEFLSNAQKLLANASGSKLEAASKRRSKPVIRDVLKRRLAPSKGASDSPARKKTRSKTLNAAERSKILKLPDNWQWLDD